ncbi:type VI secretion system protein TssL, long form [Bosea sp. (in: a-proteobacteria)]|uniref:type VI secretion system protein TssL, long form n=1 Tax=Bosea sp. (in: a-proteobacteria) TaxID=1871050 RepID=UPI002735D966|nr:type VI secretion system protein TssL, long form [Bosea sp. (in: a-proteobacteria)]MDP3410990.1 type VI secretion system protein TssL, long form [Bosea sp. (in: a-proteobacteria)]
MSDPGSPSDPFGRSDRTIIRPNPAGRRAPLPSRPAQATPAAPTPYAPPAAASPGVPGGSDDWISAAQPAPPRPAPPPGPAAGPLPGRGQLLTPNANPLLRAASPLLLLLGRLRSQLSSAPPAQLLGQVTETIEAFEHEVRAAGASAEQTRTAKYVLCAAADDIVQNIPGEDRHVWTQYSMLSKFFGERVGGVRFFEELDRAKADPSVNYDLLELMHACLALGFQGIHRTSAGGAANLQMIQRNLFETLRRVKQPDPELSPRWRGQAVASQVARFKVPVWSVAALAGVAVLGLYFVFRFLLSGNAEAAATAMLSVHPKGELGLVRKVFSAPPPPVPPPPEPPKVCGAVQPPIVCQVTPNVIIVRLVDITLFEPGQAAVRAEFKPLIERIATVLETEGGAVKVVGHTDNVPIRTARFASNLQLSQARAKAVGDLLQTKLSKPDRISVEGKGADAPIADNASREGRAKNRRVEIVIQRQG